MVYDSTIVTVVYHACLADERSYERNESKEIKVELMTFHYIFNVIHHDLMKRPYSTLFRQNILQIFADFLKL